MMENRPRWIWYAVGFGCLGIMLAWPRHGRADQSTLLTVVREGHRAARQSILSFSATVTDKITHSKRGEFMVAAEYWRSSDTVHIRQKKDGGTSDMLLKDGEIRQVGRTVDSHSPRQQVEYLAYRRAAVEALADCDVWERMMIDSGGPNGGRYDFDHFLEFAQRPPQASRVRDDGHDCIRLTLSIVSTTGVVQHVTLWHDVDHNYLVWKTVVTHEKSTHRSERKILEFAEPVPGVFVPTKCRAEWYRGGELISHEEITLSDVKVNEPVSASDLALPAIPAGTILNDRIRGTSYPINENWEAIGPSKPLQLLTVPGKSESAPSDYHSQSTSEAKPLSRLLVPVSLFVLVAACAGLIYRHYRRHGGLRRAN
jgi:hypothetical protein